MAIKEIALRDIIIALRNIIIALRDIMLVICVSKLLAPPPTPPLQGRGSGYRTDCSRESVRLSPPL